MNDVLAISIDQMPKPRLRPKFQSTPPPGDTKEFAESAAADSLSDIEILEPTLLIIGDILRSKLPAGH